MLRFFVPALEGFMNLIRTERNFKLHIISACIVITFGIYFGISQAHWMWIFASICMVLTTEALNTAIEKMMDFVQPEQDKSVKIIKDIAAAAVLITASFSAIIGGLIFLPYIKNLLGI